MPDWLRSVLVVALALIGTGVEAQTDWLETVIGRYEGHLVDSGGRQPATTILYRNKTNGLIAGEYTFATGSIPGKLEDCAPIGLLELQCTWIDKFGRGGLYLSFDDEVTRFAGRWTAGGVSLGGLPWHGRRVGPGS